MSELSFMFHNPTKLLFGSGKLAELHNERLPGKKALLLISSGKSVRTNGSLARTEEELRLAGADYVIFDKIIENPLNTTVMEAAAFARENHCDFIVALGGGAVLDSSVAVAAMATNDGQLWDYVWGGTGGRKSLANPALPVVTIATTSGTGSEINAYGVISNLETKEKIGFGFPELVPVLAVVDPTYMKSVPPKYTAYQGFDALFHNTEVMISRGLNILSETLALSCIESIARYLPRAVADGNDLEARERVAYASTVAGMTMQLTSTTAAHSMEHSMSAFHHNLQHGAGLIIIAREFYQFFIDRHACDERFVKMARAMGAEGDVRPQDFIIRLTALEKACGVDDLRMSDYGFSREELPQIAKGARSMQGGLYEANPCELSDDDVSGILARSYK